RSQCWIESSSALQIRRDCTALSHLCQSACPSQDPNKWPDHTKVYWRVLAGAANWRARNRDVPAGTLDSTMSFGARRDQFAGRTVCTKPGSCTIARRMMPWVPLGVTDCNSRSYCVAAPEVDTASAWCRSVA